MSVEARPDQVSVLRAAAAAAGDAAGFPPNRVEDIRLAVGEASANAVVHAYPDEPGSIELRIYSRPGALNLVVADRGSGMRPRADSPGLGLGLPLIGALADRVELGGDHGGTDVSMTFERMRAVP